MDKYIPRPDMHPSNAKLPKMGGKKQYPSTFGNSKTFANQVVEQGAKGKTTGNKVNTIIPRFI